MKTERLVLRCVSWRIQLPTSYTFLSIFKHALGLEPRTVALACYLLVSPGLSPAVTCLACRG